MKRVARALAPVGCLLPVALLSAALLVPTASAQPAPGAFVDVPGGKLWYETCGSGPKTMVLLHDGMLHSVVWDDVWPGLCKTFRVVRYDRRGYGRSPEAKAPYSPVEDVAAVMKASGMDHAAIVGASSGGGIAVDFALSHPKQVDRLVLVGPAVSGVAGTGYFAMRQLELMGKVARGDYRGAIKDSWLLARDDEANVERLLKLAQANPQNMNHQDPATPSPPAAPRLNEIKVPTIVLVGEDDAADNHAQAGVVSHGIPGSVRIVIPKAGHLLYVEQPAQFVRILDRFAGGDKGMPTPGAEDALRSLIGELQSGSTEFSRVNPALALVLRQQGDQFKRGLAAMGPLKSITFQQVDVADSDVYVVAFERARLQCHLRLDNGGRILGLQFLPAR